MAYPQELITSVGKPWGPFSFLSSQLFRQQLRYITGAAQGVQRCGVAALCETAGQTSLHLLSSGWPCCGHHPRPALEPVADLRGSISQCTPCNNRLAALCMGISGWGSQWESIDPLPDRGHADIGAHFVCISSGDDSPYLSATVIRLFPKHFPWEAGQQRARCLELSAEGSVTDLLTHFPAKGFYSPWRTWGLWNLQTALIRKIAAWVSFFFTTEEFLLNAILTFDVVSLQFLFWGQSF